DPQGHARARAHQGGPRGLPLPRQSRRAPRLGARPRLRARAVADAAAARAGRLRDRDRRAALGPRARRDRRGLPGLRSRMARQRARRARHRRGFGKNHRAHRLALLPSDGSRQPARRRVEGETKARLATRDQLREHDPGDDRARPRARESRCSDRARRLSREPIPRMNRDSKIYIAGHRGLVGSALHRAAVRRGFTNVVVRTRAELDLRDAAAVERFFAAERPEYVFLAAAKVGGILANDTYPAEFIGDNLKIQVNVIDAAYRFGVRKLWFLGSSCVYPRLAPQPIKEDALLTGPLEPTNEWYAVAKIAGIKMCQAYARQYGFAAISLMPTNLYGPNDNFDLETSHVLPALLRKF